MKFEICLAFCLFAVAFASEERVSFNGYQVFRTNPATFAQAEALVNLESTASNVDFWTEPSTQRPTDIMVAPGDIESFKQFMDKFQIPFDVMIPDVEKVATKVSRQGETQKPVDWKDYNTFEEIHAWLHKVEKDNAGRAKTEKMGYTTEKRPLEVLVLGNGAKKVWIDGGIHAREWISPAVVTFIINELVKPENAALLKTYQWHFLPVQNPDGYNFTFTTHRMWRKTRSILEGTSCRGVDANRNYDFQWATGGSSPDKCHDAYHGPKANSEPEVALVDAYMRKHSFHIVLTLHSYSQFWMLPYAYTSTLPTDHTELLRAANVAAKALKSVNGLDFRVGTINQIIGFVSGSSVDWMKVVAKGKYTYALELRDKGRHGFLLPPDQIIPSGLETWAAVKALAIDVQDL